MLEYPFDCDYILQNKRAIKKELLKKEGLLEKKIAILSGTTVGEIKNILELFLLDFGIKPEFFVGDYGRFYEDVAFDDGSLAAFAPDVIIFNTSLHNVEPLPFAGEDAATCDKKLDAAFNRFKAAYDAAKKFSCAVVANNFEYPLVRVMGSYEAVSPSGKVRFVNRLNEKLARYAEENSNFYVNDVCYLSARCGLDAYSDPSYYNSYKYAVNPAMIPYYCHSLACIVKSVFGKNKKALFLDLDGTLWGGVIGDDGVDGIALGIENPAGIAYTDMQKYARELAGIGVLLGVCSKNEKDAALSGFTHPSSVLKPDDFACFCANWEPKSNNLAASAKQLNLGVDSFVFADDNPAEREIVRQTLPDTGVPELGASERYAETISSGGWFEVTSLSADDVKRAEMYKQNALREAAATDFTDYAEYLRSLRMTGYIGPFTEARLERITSLANKTNQFNLTTRRYQPDEMAARMRDENVVALAGRLEDKFGDNGLVTELIAVKKDGALDVELWIMSCRVFKRELEYAMFDALVAEAKRLGVMTITGSYLKTAKNAVVKDFYESLGFVKTSENGDDSEWSYAVPDDYENKNHSIEVIYGQD